MKIFMHAWKMILDVVLNWQRPMRNANIFYCHTNFRKLTCGIQLLYEDIKSLSHERFKIC